MAEERRAALAVDGDDLCARRLDGEVAPRAGLPRDGEGQPAAGLQVAQRRDELERDAVAAIGSTRPYRRRCSTPKSSSSHVTHGPRWFAVLPAKYERYTVAPAVASSRSRSRPGAVRSFAAGRR